MDFMGNIGTQSCTWAFASRLASGPSVRKELKFEVLTIFEKIHLENWLLIANFAIPIGFVELTLIPF